MTSWCPLVTSEIVRSISSRLTPSVSSPANARSYRTLAARIFSVNSLASSGIISTIYAGKPQSRASGTQQEKPTILPWSGSCSIDSACDILHPPWLSVVIRPISAQIASAIAAKTFSSASIARRSCAAASLSLGFDLLLNATNREHCKLGERSHRRSSQPFTRRDGGTSH